ncbi:BsaA family SipW-dependent biofilm matrix protein [Candidatus Saccharibacteria bacterium]|nr:BsaA family SipW-dependent biofilm matrix protein [Candidatus Saccharibacteria bacterium]
MKNKKSLFAIVGILIVAAVGTTVALYTSNVILANNFSMADYKTETTESFVSPENWQPCDITPKTVSVTNRGSVDVAVRIKLDDFWKDKDGNDLPDLMSGDQKLTSINFHDGYENYWEKKGDWYVYKTNLAPNATTEPLIDSVSLSCNANLTGTTTYSADGQTGETGASPYAGGKFHVKATVQTIQADQKEEWTQEIAKVIERKANPREFRIDFTKKAVVSDDIFVANGNGVNEYTENGRKIYYYRGNVDDNNIIWGNLCWKIVRTTANGGTKMIYNGAPTTVNGAKQCNAATAAATQINGTNYRYNGSSWSPADVGYQYGDRIEVKWQGAGSGNYTFANDISRNGNTYTLDTSDGQSVSGTWADIRATAATRYHYFCTNGASSCSNTQIGYVHYYADSGTIYYLPVGGYNDIEDMKDKMFSNNNNSGAKNAVEGWFRSNGLDRLEDDLEDAVYCNDRTIGGGALKSKDTPTSIISNRPEDADSPFGEYYRAKVVNDNNNIEPQLTCPELRDAFTKSAANGNGRLGYKVGLLTASELVLAGIPQYDASLDDHGEDPNNYLFNGNHVWTISPFVYFYNYAGNFIINLYMSQHGVYDSYGLRPVVTLKAGTEYARGTGLKTDPYIVE